MRHAPLPILYQDDWLVAIDKPSGWLVHRSNLDRHETRIAVQALRDQIGRHVHPVHRLDKGTSGVLLFALSPEVCRQVGEQFAGHETRKTYRAIVRGWPPESGRIDHPLRDIDDAYDHTTTPETPREAITDYRRLATVELPCTVDRYPTARYALLAVSPVTGRRHQIRRHLKHIAHPIVGDATYGKGRHNRFFQAEFGCARLLLACVALGFRHPVTNAPVTLTAPLSGCFARTLKALGWADEPGTGPHSR